MTDQWPYTQLFWTPNRDSATPIKIAGSGSLSFAGISTLPGVKGLDAPPYLYSFTETPGLDGAHLNNVRVPSREIFIPIYLEGDSRGQLLQRKRDFINALSPIGQNGPGRLTVTEGDNSSRVIDAYYQAGAEGDEGKDISGFYWCKYGLIFRAFDPYFYASEVESRTFRGDTSDIESFFSSPFFGLHLNTTLAFNGSISLDVVGDVSSWPVWTIRGPIDKAVFANIALAQEFTITHTIEVGESIVVDTTPGRKSVRLLSDDSNLWPALSPNPQLWPIAPYSNQIEITLEGLSVDTEVILEYRPRYLSA